MRHPRRAQRDWVDSDGRPLDEVDRGLVYDLQTMVDRRAVFGLFAGVGAAALLAACSGSSGSTATAVSTQAGSTQAGATIRPASTTAATGTVTEVPDETAGPYPGDGSNGPDVLTESGIVRRDIRSSFGSSTTAAAGVPLTVRLTVETASTGRPATGAAVYLWHCDRDGNYSLYSAATTGENYLRGVQEGAADGTVTFTTIFPGCYPGRWPHLHFEVYANRADAVGSGPIVKTSQIALPASACRSVYATTGYSASTTNLARVSLTTDSVFADDGAVHQLASMSGNATSGYTASLAIGV